MKSHEASCHCGKLSLTYTGEITKTSVCHCFECQKRTGSVFGVQTRLDVTKTEIKGEAKIFKRTGDGGSEISFHFCPHCGSTLYWTADWAPGAVIATIGAFCDPSLPAPVMQVYGNRKHQWVMMPESAVEYFD